MELENKREELEKELEVPGNAENEKPEETVAKGTIIREWIRDILVAIVVAIVIMQFIKPTIVKQRSMEPNFYTNDYLLVSRQAYGLFGGDPQRGDVIVFQSDLSDDNGASKLLIKRVIGLPGDSITITEGKVYINGEMQIDSYTKDQMTNGEIVDLVVPENSLFCMGDNRLVSVDSRAPEVGFISYDVVVGKVVLRLFPFSEFGTIMNPYKGE